MFGVYDYVGGGWRLLLGCCDLWVRYFLVLLGLCVWCDFCFALWLVVVGG